MNSNEPPKVPFIQFVLNHQKHWMNTNIYDLEAFIDDGLGNNWWKMQEIFGNISIIDRTDDIEETWHHIDDARRPIILMRGTPVTEDQALEIISRTDRLFHFASNNFKGEAVDLFQDEYMAGIDFDNNWFMSNIMPGYSGWCHPDGTIGITDIASKYPQFEDVLMEFGRYIHAFPYLNFVAVYTGWDETPDSLWDVDYDKRTPQLINEAIEKGLAYNITVGFWVHDNTIEVLNPKDAYNKLKEVERSVGKPSIKYSNYYYSDNKIIPYTPDYLQHCIDSYTNEKVRDQLLKNVKHEALHQHIKI